MINNHEDFGTQKGLLVIDELPGSIAPNLFIRFLTPLKKYPSYMSARWLKSKNEKVEISLLFAEYTYPDGKPVCLYCFPEAIGHPFGNEDFETPVETVGFLVIIDVDRLLQLNQKVPEAHSAIYWAKSYHYQLPVIIAVTNASKIEMSTEKLTHLVDYSPDMPIIWCDGDMDYDFVQRTLGTIYSYV